MRPKVNHSATLMSAKAQVARAALREDRKQAEAAADASPLLTFEDFEEADGAVPVEEDDEEELDGAEGGEGAEEMGGGCEVSAVAEGVTLFVCGSRRAATCSVCGEDAPHRCDHKIDAAGRSCGAALCGKHRRKIGDYNLCQTHVAARRAATAAAATTPAPTETR